MAWLYVPELPEQSLDSGSCSPIYELSVTSSGKHTLRPLSWRGWKTRPWIELLSGTISRPSMADRGVDSWISSLRATRASHSAPLESALAKLTSATSGLTSGALLTRYVPDSCSVRTSQITFGLDSKPSEENYEKWAMSLRQDCTRRLNAALRIYANGYSSSPLTVLLPTPAATRGGHNQSPSLGAAVRPSLDTMARKNLWPTPQAHDATSGNAARVGRFGTEHGGRNLNDWVQMWPTPTVHGNHNRVGISPTSGNGLATAVKMFPTPVVADGTRGSNTYCGGNPTLRGAAGGQLNPTWVEWLMGWPAGWSDCSCSVTGLSQWLRLSRSQLFGTSTPFDSHASAR